MGHFGELQRTKKTKFPYEAKKKPEGGEHFRLIIWPHRQESNLYLPLRRRPFYPLNYGGRLAWAIIPEAHW